MLKECFTFQWTTSYHLFKFFPLHSQPSHIQSHQISVQTNPFDVFKNEKKNSIWIRASQIFTITKQWK